MVAEPPILRELRAATIAAIVTVGFALVEWFSPHPPPTWPRTFLPTLLLAILHVLVLMCVWHVVAFCFAAAFAKFARKQLWAPQACYLAGNLFMMFGITALTAAEFLHLHRLRLMITLWGFILMCLRTRPGKLCRTLAFPEFAEEESRRILYPRRLAVK